MIELTLITVGKLKEKFYQEASAEYIKRLGAYCRFNIIELGEEKRSRDPSQREIETALEALYKLSRK